MSLRFTILLLTGAATSGCFYEETVKSRGAAITDGTAEAAGVLSFLNGPNASLVLLDDEIRLDRRAAKSIAEFTRGADGVYATADDGRLQTLVELDELYWVGSSAIGKILDHVQAIGGIPDIEVEGVFLTTEQANKVVATVNGASLSQLDDEARLDSRAASGIVDARPLADIFALASVPYVGSSALKKLASYSQLWQPTSPPPDFPAQVSALFADHGISGAVLDFPGDVVAAQAQLFGNEVSFEQALDAALSSYRFDDDDAESPLEVVRNVGPYPPCEQSADAERLQCFLNVSSTVFGIIRHEGDPDEVDMYLPEHGERPIDGWIVYLLMPSTGDHMHWAVVGRTLVDGEISVYNYGFN